MILLHHPAGAPVVGAVGAKLDEAVGELDVGDESEPCLSGDSERAAEGEILRIKDWNLIIHLL